MRTLRFIGALIGALAFGAFAVATANAAETLWRWLPGSAGETFTGKSGKSTFEIKGGNVTTCTASEIGAKTGELLKEGSTEGKDATLALVISKLTGCKAFGLFPINSKGDPAEVILLHLEIHNCVIKSGDFGLLFTLLEVTLEVPAAKEVLVLKGSFIGLVEANKGKENDFLVNIKQKGGVQEIERCEGGEFNTLFSSLNGGAFIQTGIEVSEFLLAFDKVKDAKEEIML